MFLRTNWMKWVFVSFGAILLIIFGAAAYALWGHSIVLERGRVLQLKVVEHRQSGVMVVHVSGWCAEEFYETKRVEAIVEGSSINLLVYAFIMRPGGTGEIEYDATVPPAVNEIRFGKNQVVIWRRGTIPKALGGP